MSRNLDKVYIRREYLENGLIQSVLNFFELTYNFLKADWGILWCFKCYDWYNWNLIKMLLWENAEFCEKIIKNTETLRLEISYSSVEKFLESKNPNYLVNQQNNFSYVGSLRHGFVFSISKTVKDKSNLITTFDLKWSISREYKYSYENYGVNKKLTFCLCISKCANRPIPKLLTKILPERMMPTLMLIPEVQRCKELWLPADNACAKIWNR